MKKMILLSLLTLALATALPAVHAQTGKWPDKPVRIVVPFAPGGGTDIVARVIAAALSEEFGQQFVVDNRPGAGSLIGSEIVARATPDGYTLCVVSTSYTGLAALHKLPYDPVKGIEPISMLATGPLILLIHPSVKANTLEEFLTLARAKPGTLNYGSSGTAGTVHLASELLSQLTQTNMQHVSYKGTSPAMTDLLGGYIQFMLTSMPVAVPQMKANALRALAVTTIKRWPTLPELPAISEQVPGFEYVSWHGMWTTGGTPKEIVSRLNQSLERLLKRPDVQKRMQTNGVEPTYTTSEEFRGRLDREITTWKKVVKDGNIKIN